MFKQSNDALEQLQKLRETFTASLPEKLHIIELLWQTIKQHNVDNSEQIEALYLTVHSLAGSAGTFGHKQLGEMARQFEHILQQNLGKDESLSDATIHIIDSELNKFKELSI